MDGLVKNDSIDLLYMVMPRAADESICGKLSHANSMCARKQKYNVGTAQRDKERSVGTIHFIDSLPKNHRQS